LQRGSVFVQKQVAIRIEASAPAARWPSRHMKQAYNTWLVRAIEETYRHDLLAIALQAARLHDGCRPTTPVWPAHRKPNHARDSSRLATPVRDGERTPSGDALLRRNSGPECHYWGRSEQRFRSENLMGNLTIARKRHLMLPHTQLLARVSLLWMHNLACLQACKRAVIPRGLQ
jgi:hypothetical protein